MTRLLSSGTLGPVWRCLGTGSDTSPYPLSPGLSGLQAAPLAHTPTLTVAWRGVGPCFPLYWTELTCPCWSPGAPWEGRGWGKAGALCPGPALPQGPPGESGSCPGVGWTVDARGPPLPKGKGGTSGGAPLPHTGLASARVPTSSSLETKPLLPALPPHPSLGAAPSTHLLPVGFQPRAVSPVRAGTDLARSLPGGPRPWRDCQLRVSVIAKWT